jgi:hypothetical protein
MIGSMPTVEAIAPSFFVKDLTRSVDLGPALIVLVHAAPGPAGVIYKSACHLRLASGVDEYVAQIEAAGQPLTAAAKDRPEYGMREAHVRDPDGNDIYIGQQI